MGSSAVAPDNSEDFLYLVRYDAPDVARNIWNKYLAAGPVS